MMDDLLLRAIETGEYTLSSYSRGVLFGNTMRTMLTDGTYIRIRNLRAAGIIGVDESERASAQPLNVNLWLQIDAGRAGTTDALGDTIDYRLIRQLVLDRIAASRFHVLEALVHAILADLKGEARILAARVDVEKPGALRRADAVSLSMTWRR